jgi:TRAP-type C4-dicarboxylate transport system substrate-binding protein
MGTARSTRKGVAAASLFAVTTLIVTGCTGGGTPAATDTEHEEVTISVATSQNEETPNYYCGVALLQERLEAADIGFTVELYPASQLGPDADRFPQVQAGDIDIDLQGASALSATFAPIGVVDAAYAFDDVDHAFRWIDEGSTELFDAFHEATNVRVIDGWFFGNRTFSTKDIEVHSPEDLDGVPIRFPNSPAFLANAEALGVTNPVSVAVEEAWTPTTITRPTRRCSRSRGPSRSGSPPSISSTDAATADRPTSRSLLLQRVAVLFVRVRVDISERRRL